MNISLGALLIGFVLLLIQLLAALPWMALAFLSPEERDNLRANPFPRWLMQRLLIALLVCAGLPLVLLTFVRDRDSLETLGRVYAAILQIQITLDLFILLFAALLWVWPKGAAVAQAAFREGIRQWLFWLLTAFAAFLMFISVFVPYFTFGEDYLMVKQLGYDTIMLFAVIFGALTASLSISEEIEGRTAITVMSKPISRRQFMLGKYAGIVMACLFMFGVLGVFFEGMLFLKHWWDRLEPFHQVQESALSPTQQVWIGVVPMPAWVNEMVDRFNTTEQARALLRGIGHWAAHMGDTLPGLVLCFSQVMVLVGLAVALATRVPMVVNLITVVAVFWMAHITPILLAVSGRAVALSPDKPQHQVIRFVSRVFDTVLPDLGSFRMDPALLSDAPPPMWSFAQYVGSVTLYGVVYTAIVLLLGLILFEDRDLA